MTTPTNNDEVRQNEQTNNPELNRKASSAIQRHSSMLFLGGVLLGLIALLALAINSSTQETSLYPVLPTFTPLVTDPDDVAIELSFTELNSNPSAFQDRRIHVSGIYTPISPPDCRPVAGVPIRWSLVSEGLQLNARGFENVLSLVRPGTELVVVGLWRNYQGPVGCGKEPPPGIVWYLEVIRIIEPNPLIGEPGIIALTVVSDNNLPGLGTIEALTTPTPSQTPTPMQTPEIEVTGQALTPIIPIVPELPSETPTLAFPPTVTSTPDPNATPTFESTPDGPETGTPDPDASATMPGSTPQTPDPNLPTSTPSGTGYPPDATDTPTGSYP
jgi:hypothetical protein